MLDIEPYKHPSNDLFYTAKHDENGNVRPGWSYAEWLAFYWAGIPKTSTRNCHTAGYQKKRP